MRRSASGAHLGEGRGEKLFFYWWLKGLPTFNYRKSASGAHLGDGTGEKLFFFYWWLKGWPTCNYRKSILGYLLERYAVQEIKKKFRERNIRSITKSIPVINSQNYIFWIS
jgi:hypothetical protein